MGILAVDSIKSRTVAPVTISDDLSVTGVSTYTGAITASGGIVGDVTGTATTATNATGLTGSPSITITDVNASGIITATSFAGDGSALTGITQTTINNNANNLVITGSGTANTLEAESQFTYDGTNLQLKKTGSSDYNEIIQDANPSTENSTLGYLSGYWNTTRVADIRFAAGDDTSNKDNAHICFRTTNAGSGSITDRLRIGNLGQIGLPVGGVGVAATDWGSSGQVLTSGGSSAVASWATPSSGAWEKLTSGTMDSSTVTTTITTTHLTSSHQLYRLTYDCELSPPSGESVLGLEVQIGGTWRSDTNYYYVWNSGGSSSSDESSKPQFLLGKMGRRFQGEVTFMDPSGTSDIKQIASICSSTNSNASYSEGLPHRTIGAYYGSGSTGAVTGIRLKSFNIWLNADGYDFSKGYFVLEGCAVS